MDTVDVTMREQAEFAEHGAAYVAWQEKTQREWLSKNNTVSPYVVYELMTKAERVRVDGVIAAWKRYITPLAEAWWLERGYLVEWPDNDETGKMRLRKMS